MKWFHHSTRLACLLILTLWSLLSYAQADTTEIFEFEYFFDNDPGFGNATTISVGVPAIDVNTLETLTSSGLTTGFHTLGFRARNLSSRPYYGEVNPSTLTPFGFKPSNWIDPLLLTNGDWGITETRLIYVDPSDPGGIINVDEIEYFFDNDPGVGSGILVDPFSPNSNVSLTQTLTSSGLTTGFHTLGARARAEGGAWGTTETRLVFVDQTDGVSIINVDEIEYFFDTDPGVGSASLVTSFTASNMVSIVESLNSSALSTGFHILGMRARAEGGAWGITETRLVFVDQTDGVSIINVDQIEYFFDNDPGVGSATLVTSFTANNMVSIVESLNSNALSTGFHILGMRARAEGGAWGTTETRLIFVDQSDAGSIVNVDQIEYFFDSDPGVGSATLVTSFTANNMISIAESLNSNALSTGFHILGMRARAEGGAWGPTETRLVFVDPGGIFNDVAGFEYFVGDDPGVGQASEVLFSSPDFNVSEEFTLNTDTLTIGSYQISFRARDDQGNWGHTESRPLDVVNLAAPVISSNDSITNSSPANILITFGEAVTDFAADDITVDNGSVDAASFTDNGDNTFNVNIDLSSEGLVMIDIADSAAFAVDDNTASPNAKTFEITYDLMAPNVTIDTLSTIEVSPELTGNVDDSLAAVEVLVDGNTYTAVNNGDSTWTLASGTISPDLAAGIYDVDIIATDLAGNEGVDTTTNELTIIGGEVSFVSVDSLLSNSRSPQLTGKTSNLTVSVEVLVDGNTYTATNNGDSTWTLAAGVITPDLADGTFDVQASIDESGEVTTDTTLNELIIDATVPIVTVDALVTSIPSPSLTGTLDDASATIEVTVSGNTYVAENNGDGTWVLAAGTIAPDLGEGVYEVAVSATDAAGNVGLDETTDELEISQTILTLSATEVTSTSFTANWIQAADVQTYSLEVSTTSDFSSMLSGYDPLEVTADQTSTSVTGLDFGTSYYYRVRFTNTSSDESDNSNTTNVKTIIDPETTADSLALLAIYNAVNPSGLNWDETSNARLRDWTGVTLDNTRTRVTGIDMSDTQSAGDLPNPFSAEVLTDNGLSALTTFSAQDNALTRLIDFASTSIESVNVSNNHLTFSDLEPLVGTPTFSYSPQADLTFIAETNAEFLKDTQLERLGIVRIVPRGESYTLLTGLSGTNNTYSWTKDGTAITQGDRYTMDGSSLTINTIAIDNMGQFAATVTNDQLPDLTLTVLPEYVFGVANLEMRLTDFDDTLLPEAERFLGALLETEARGSGYDTLDKTQSIVPSLFTFEDVILGDYLCGIDPENRDDYVPTYFGDAFTWEEADTIEVRENTTLSIAMTEDPGPPPGDGPGNLDVLIEEDFGDETARVHARRAAKKRKCGLRRRRTGGRIGQEDDEYELFAYGETDDNGEFKFGFLPEGKYRFFVEYPGIPLDENAFVEFEVGELGISDTEFSLSAFATEEGVEVTIERVLGVILTYFKDLEVYPNPADDQLHIRYRHLKSAHITAELIDLTGKRQWTQELRQGYDGELAVNLTDIISGLYILRFYDRTSRQDNLISYRIVVKAKP